MPMIPRICDIYHGDNVEGKDCVIGFTKAKNAGVWGIIHKATQGAEIVDSAYKRRRAAAEKVGLLWGAYHFNTGEKVRDQIDNFFKVAAPDKNTLMVLDFEDNKRSQMSIEEAVSFMKGVEDRLGRSCAIYSGNKLKESIDDLSSDEFDYIISKKLWLCQYGPKAKFPKGFKKYWLWQYTGDGIGPLPHYVPGITVPGGTGIDLNAYDGDLAQLQKEWVS
jgi:GH25 family lysozyme M1 (1,4-beta-N-acetylmuramidase)